MKRRNVIATFVLAAGLMACGRQQLDLAAAGGGASQDGAARVTVVVADHPAPGVVGRDCSEASVCSWWQEPDPAELCCGGVCADTAGDPLNCGACGHACARGQVCAAGLCGAPVIAADCAVTPCSGGAICCGGKCVNPSVDRVNCGACGLTCRFEGASCLVGVCCPGTDPTAACRAATCPEGRVQCGAACEDLGVDPNNCGACGAVCPPTARRCVAGLCVSA